MTDANLIDQIQELERQIYELRKEVAHVAPSELPEQGELALLVFRVGGERFGLALSETDEVVPVAHLAALPEAPPWVPGLLNLRGESIPVLDAAARFRRRARRLALSDLIVVCSWGERRVGLVIQEILDVQKEDYRNVHPPGDVAYGPYLLGVLETSGDPILLLSMDRLLDLSDIPEERD